ncbi:BLUF domain-containing protein [Hymenobacter sp. YC55]|uniref:BLUF domain-containing protein n=1 Tax=Hymenobacter sp. YC55 TaxID=3034019 RepID=UPI0023F7FAE4|nr:BLUF domain-containing protein [Hymenobacter sp. YC55]MDF7815414.1 BLUF domain-containing protein [Hymenobacter sp. YC55]
MHRILYLSRLAAPLPEAELQQLFTRAQVANLVLGVTGALFYSPGDFAQLLEGEQFVVEKLYLKIAADPRHTGVIKLADNATSTRDFASWAMAPLAVSGTAFQAVTAYLYPEEAPTTRPALAGTDALLYNLVRAATLPLLR